MQLLCVQESVEWLMDDIVSAGAVGPRKLVKHVMLKKGESTQSRLEIHRQSFLVHSFAHSRLRVFFISAPDCHSSPI